MVVVITLPLAIYIPPVQDALVAFAVGKVNAGGQIKVDYKRVRLSWPLRLEAEGVNVITPPADTMLHAGHISLQVESLPLLALRVCANASISDARYAMGHPDSAMWLTAEIDDFKLNPSTFHLASSGLDISNATLDGARIRMIINPTDSVVETPDSTSSLSMTIAANRLRLRNVDFAMTMMPTIDSLGVVIGDATLKKGVVDLGNQTIDTQSLNVDSVTATYLLPSMVQSPETDKTTVQDTTTTKPWVVTAGHLALTAQQATYGVRGHIPAPGLDMGWLQVSNVIIEVDSFYNRSVEIKVPLRRIEATERCGLHLAANGTFSMDSTTMRADSFNISTYFSDITLNALMGMGDMAHDTNLPLRLSADARLGFKDIASAMPSLRPLLSQMPAHRDLTVNIKADGTTGDLNLHSLAVALPDYFRLAASGNVAGLPSTDNLNGDISLDGRVYDTPLLRSKILRQLTGPSVDVPPLSLGGNIAMRRGAVIGNLKATTGGGDIALDAMWNGRLTAYAIDLKADGFPVNAFLPTAGIGPVTTTADIKGNGFDPSSPATHITADMSIGSVRFNNRELRDINVRAALDSCHITADIASTNADADLNMTLNGRIDSTTWYTTVGGNVRNLDLQALGLSSSPLAGSFTIDGDMTLNPGDQLYCGLINVARLSWNLGDIKLATDKITVDLNITDSIINAKTVNGDFNADINAACGFNALLASIDSSMKIVNDGLAARHIYIDSLQKTMPHFSFNLTSGTNSLLGSVIQQSGIDFNRLNLAMANDSTMHMLADVNGITMSRQKIDSVAISLSQKTDTIHLASGMFNRPGTFDKFATVTADGTLKPNEMTIMLNQRDIQGNTGYRVGLNLQANDSSLEAHLLPEKPVINYKDWTLNTDNYIVYHEQSRLIDADLRLSDGPSFLRLLTLAATDDTTATAENIQITAEKIHLADWIAVSPFAPPVKGDLATDIHLRYDPVEKSIGGKGTMQLADLYYGKSRVGTFDLGLDLATNARKVIQATLSLDVDSAKVLTASGALNDSTATTPLAVNVNLYRFPMSLANPFLPKDMASLSGWLNGEMKAAGTMTTPRLDGYLNFDSADVTVAMMGTRFGLSTEPIRVDSGVVRFDNFSIIGANANPLSVNGTVDLSSFADPKIDLSLKATNMQILKSERKRGQELYGKAFIDLEADIRGNMDMMGVNANLTLLSGSNLTYAMGGTTTDLPSLVGSSEAVKFVQFSDSTAVAEADSIDDSGMAMMLNARLNIAEGTTVNVDLSATNAQDRAQVSGAGSLTFTMSPFSDMRLTGRYNINSGFVRYTPPLMSQKDFKFQRGSYVAFNGDILNPTLNIEAIDQIRANVTETGQNSRLVNFDVILKVTQTLENMNVAFDLTTDDDITVKNELQAMSPDQRANQAMNMLLYNVYTGPSTKGSANMSGNPLFSFLASTINSWAANNIKGVELTFGVEQYDRTYNGNTSTATSYNYQVSKSFVNDRLKVVVGGNYTDDDASTNNQDYKQNLINDISFEYMLNRSGTMYVRLFRHTGFESILEGEVTQTGLGFVYRRKLGSLYSLLPRFLRPRRWRHPDKPLSTKQIIDNAIPQTIKEENTPTDNDEERVTK